MTARDNMDIVRRFVDALNRHDPDLALSVVDENAEFFDVPTSQSYRGHQEIKQLYHTFLTAFPDEREDITNLFAGDDDWVCVEYTSRGTFKGPLSYGPVKAQPTGRTFEWPTCDVFQVKNGKIVKIRSYSDTYTFVNQVGISLGASRAA